MIYRFIYASILYLVCFIPYWNVNKHEQSSSILDFDVCDLDLDYIQTRSSNSVTTAFHPDYILCFAVVCR